MTSLPAVRKKLDSKLPPNFRGTSLSRVARLEVWGPKPEAGSPILKRSDMKILTCSAFLLAAVAFFPMLLQAQTDSQGMSDTKSSHMSASKETATGCLQKGDEPNGYTLTADDGKVWELQGTKVKLADHVGHKVT